MASALYKIKGQGDEAPCALEKLSGQVNDSIHKLIAQLRIPSWANMRKASISKLLDFETNTEGTQKAAVQFVLHSLVSSASARSGEPFSAAKRAKTTSSLSAEKLAKIALMVDILLADMQISYRDIQAWSSGLMESFDEARSDPPKLLAFRQDLP
jgi:hypothetical protein